MNDDGASLTILLQCFFLILTIGGLGSALFYFIGRIRTVPEGHVAVIEQLQKYKRTVGPGLYLLRPLEAEVARIYVRQREATAIVPNVFTEGGLPVVVNLRYSYRLDPQFMNRDELYYSDGDRWEQQRTLLKRVFQNLMTEMEKINTERYKKRPPQPAGQGKRVDSIALFSPFAGEKALPLQNALEPAVRSALGQHGIMVTAAPVLINGLTLPPEVSAAYTELLSNDFSSSARADFIRRMRNASPNLSEAAMVHLLNIIQNPSADVHNIFSGGTLNTDILLEKGKTSSRSSVQPSPPPSAPSTPPPSAPPAGATASPAAQPAAQPAAARPLAPAAEGFDPDYALVEADNTLLKTTRVDSN